MVTKSKKQTTVEKEQKKRRVKVGKLKLDKETVRDLTASEVRKVRGGAYDDKGPGTGCNKSARIY